MLFSYIGFVSLVDLASFIFAPPKRQTSEAQQLDEQGTTDEISTTIVIGAGVIGLCTAYHLAKAVEESNTRARHHVIVVEAAGKVFPATSATNTGILSSTSDKEDLEALTQYSYRLWEALGRREPQFSSVCGYREDANFALRKDADRGHDLIPDWLDSKPEYVPSYEADLGPLSNPCPIIYLYCVRRSHSRS